MGVTLERVQFKFASIIGELCSEPDVLSQFAVWVDLRLAEYKLKGSISLDCSGETPDPVWLQGILSALLAKKLAKQRAVPKPSGHSYGHSSDNFTRIRSPSYKSHRPTTTVNIEETRVNIKEEPYDEGVYPIGLPAHNIADRQRKRSATLGENDSDSSNVLYSHSTPKLRRSENNGNPSTESLMSIIGDGDQAETNSSLQYDSLNDTTDASMINSEEAANTSHEVGSMSDAQYADQSSTSFDRGHTSSNLGSLVQRGPIKSWRSGLVPTSTRTDRLATVFPRGSDERNKMDKLNTNNRSDRSRVNKFLRFIRSRPYEERRPMASIPVDELAPYLAMFFSTVKAHSGEEFSEGSLVRLRTSLERHLKEQNYPGSITMSPGFEIARQAFKEKQQMLKTVAATRTAIGTAIATTDISEQLKTEDLSSLIADSSKDL